MMRSLMPASLLTLLLALAPLALAEGNETTPDDKAWVDDCPPDMMCALDAPEEDNATYSGDCGGEVCAYESPGRVGPDDCIDCMKAPDEGSSCMDGAHENETCRDDVYYMDGPSRGPADGSCENCRGDASDGEVRVISAPAEGNADAASDAEKSVPGPGIAFGILAAAMGAMLLLVGRR